MRFALPILAAVMAVDAQGVTSKISPPGPMISGCLANSDGAFALAVMPIDVKNVKRAPKSTSIVTLTTFTTTTIHPGSTKTVTEEELSTMTPKTTVTPVKSSTNYVVPVSQISDGQPQDPIKTTMTGVNTSLSTMTYAVPVSTIQDGQVQAPSSVSYSTTVSTSLSTWTSVMPVYTVAAQVHQRQANESDGDSDDDEYDENARFWVPVYYANATGAVVGQPKELVDGEDNVEHKISKRTTAHGTELYTCASHKPLMALVKDNQLFDGKNWIGYIAANHQLQFDAGVAQNGALYTSGFSVCDNNKLALGKSTVFYRCLSGNFYNLYDSNSAPQCSQVQLELVKVDENC